MALQKLKYIPSKHADVLPRKIYRIEPLLSFLMMLWGVVRGGVCRGEGMVRVEGVRVWWWRGCGEGRGCVVTDGGFDIQRGDINPPLHLATVQSPVR